jgi:quinol-cytochrome oxidoreductase complex cytochrome b subunit
MEIVAGLKDVAPAGSILQLPNSRQKQQSYSPPYPVHFIHQHPAWYFTNVSIYKYVQMYTQYQWKGGKLQFPKMGI